MSRRVLLLAPAFVAAAALVGLSASTPQPVAAQGKAGKDKVDHPQLRAALHELREARASLREAKNDWPPGYKERALQHIDAATDSVKLILSVKDVDKFVGYDRNPDYYKQYADYPKLRSAVADLRSARDELRAAKADFGGHKEKALDDIDIAVGEVLVLLRTNIIAKDKKDKK